MRIQDVQHDPQSLLICRDFAEDCGDAQVGVDRVAQVDLDLIGACAKALVEVVLSQRPLRVEIVSVRPTLELLDEPFGVSQIAGSWRLADGESLSPGEDKVNVAVVARIGQHRN